MFIHLHNHTHYSILEGLPRPKDYVKRAKELGMTAVAITDTGNIYGCHELYKYAKEEGLTPILGTEIFVESVLDSKISHKLVLLAKSLEGYKNIILLVTKANLDNPGKTAKLKFSDIEDLKKEKKDLGIVCLSGPASGEIPYFILAGKADKDILARIEEYKKLFGEENYYLELLYHDDIPKQNFITDKLIELINKYDLNAVATNNCYYISKDDKQTQDVIMALGTGHELENPDRPTMINGDYSFLSEDEMQKLFGFLPQALENTAKIAEMVSIEIKTGGMLIPVFEMPEEDKKIYEEAMRLEIKDKRGKMKGGGLEEQTPLNPPLLRGEIDQSPSLNSPLLIEETDQSSSPDSPLLKGKMEQTLSFNSYLLKEEIDKVPLLDKEGLGEVFKLKSLTSDEWYLRYQSFLGLNKRYKVNLDKITIFKLVQKLNKPGLTKKLTETSPEELKELSLTYYSPEKKEILKGLSKDLQDKIERLEYELVVVHEMGFDAYFLIVADYINWAKKNGIPVGPGRGSAAGSLMAYMTGITDIDPLPYKLLFERFLNPSRVSMPDIDTDFSDKERDRVVDYCREKYGNDKVAQICTFGTFAARAAVKDVGRTFGFPFPEMKELVKLIPERSGTKLKNALEESIEFKKAYEENPKYKKIIDNALKIEGNVRQLGVHACAVIIAPQSMINWTALQYPPKDSLSIVTQYSAYPLEDLGLLKMDFLGLRNLTIIKRAQEIIKNTKGVDIDILNLNLKDKKVFEIFAKGDTTGVFQFESDGMRKYLKDLGPDNFEDLIAMVSLYRPGPIAYIPTYIDVKSGKKEKKYLTDDLIKILKNAGYSDKEIKEEGKKLDEDLSQILDITYGIAVYQEQLLFIVQYMAGFSLGEADLLRRGVGKKKKEVVEALKKEFIEKGANFRQYKPETTNYIYTEMIMPASNYSFNKSHAACYALIAYQTAYLKAYYKTEFMTSLMVSDEENVDRVVLEVGECQNLGISILPPSVNESMKHFTYINDRTIRFGLKAIKGIGDGSIDKIKEAKERGGGKFENLEQFVELCGKEVISKKTLEGLILSGAMDEFGLNRKQMIEGTSEIIKFSRRDQIKKGTNQIGLFDNSSAFKDKLELPKVEEYAFEEILNFEKEIIGFSVSGHPLDGLKKFCSIRGQKIKKLKMTFEELEALSAEKFNLNTSTSQPIPSSQDKRREFEKVQAVGVIVNIRKITTKTGNQMMFLECEGFDYDFEVMIFPRDFDIYKNKLTISKIIIANGFLDVNFKYKKKSVKAQSIQDYTISGIRETAKNLGLFDNSKRLVNLSTSSSKDSFSSTLEENGEKEEESFEEDIEDNKNYEIVSEDFEENLEQKIEENKQELEEKIVNEERFVIKIPENAVKEDLHDLKEFMSLLEIGDIKIFLNLRGQEIDTKIGLNDLVELKEWIEKKWGVSFPNVGNNFK